MSQASSRPALRQASTIASRRRWPADRRGADRRPPARRHREPVARRRAGRAGRLRLLDWPVHARARPPAPRRRRGQPVRRRRARRRRRPAPDARADHRRGPAAHRLPLPPLEGDDAAARAAGAARAAARRAGDLLRPAPRLLAGRAPAAPRATRPTSSTTATSSSPTATSGSSTGSRTSPRRRSAPRQRGRRRRPVQLVGWCLGGIMALLALAADPALPVSRVALVASPFDFSTGARSSRRCGRSPRSRSGWGITQLYRAARRRARAARQARLPAGRLRQVPDEAVDGPLQPARPRVARPDRGGRRLHGPHARLSRAHLRPALPPLLPHQRPRRRHARARATRTHRPRRRDACRCSRSRARGDGIAPVPAVPPRRGAAARRAAGRARDRARRPPRRADRPRRRGDDVDAARRVPRTAVHDASASALQRAVQSARSSRAGAA